MHTCCSLPVLKPRLSSCSSASGRFIYAYIGLHMYLCIYIYTYIHRHIYIYGLYRLT